MHAVGPPGHRRVDELERPVLQGGDQRTGGGDQLVGRLGEGGAEGGVDHVGGGQPVMDPRALGLADRRLHDVDEGRDVVVGDLLALRDRLDERVVDLRRSGPAGCGRGGRHRADVGPAFGREQLDVEPAGEPRAITEQLGHRGVARTAGSPDHLPRQGHRIVGARATRGRGRGPRRWGGGRRSCGRGCGDVGPHLHARPADRGHPAIGARHAPRRGSRRGRSPRGPGHPR